MSDPVIIPVQNTCTNATLLVKEALARIPDTEQCGDQQFVLLFEPSEYYFYADGAYVGEFYPANNECGAKTVVFPLIGRRNLTIDGGGSRFIFCDRVTAFVIQNSTNIRLQNFTVDYAFPRYNRATVVAVDESGLYVSMDRKQFGYHTENGNLVFHVGNDTLNTRSRKISVKGIAPRRATCFFYVGDIEIPINPAAPTVLVDAEEVTESRADICFRYRKDSYRPAYEVGDQLCLAYDNNRENFLVLAELSAGLTFQNINVWRNGGMGIFGQLCTDIVIDGLCVAAPEGREEYFTTTADAMHFINCDGKMEIRNSRVEHAYDDALNVHGVYCVVQEIPEPDLVKVGWGNAEQSGMIPFLAGDVAAVNDPETGRETGRIPVAQMSYPADRSELLIRFAEPVTGRMKKGDMLENPERMPVLTLENNTVLSCPHMRVSAPQMTIRGNVLGLLHADIHINDLFGFWCESGAVQQAVIEENRFVTKHHRTCIDVRSERKGENRKKHRNIIIRNNQFALPQTEAIHVDACESLTLEDNHFHLISG